MKNDHHKPPWKTPYHANVTHAPLHTQDPLKKTLHGPSAIEGQNAIHSKLDYLKSNKTWELGLTSTRSKCYQCKVDF
jgi:hypothetical protein